ncbi:MAG: hypothetical protein ABJQ71_18875 [Roseibium sp.]
MTRLLCTVLIALGTLYPQFSKASEQTIYVILNDRESRAHTAIDEAIKGMPDDVQGIKIELRMARDCEAIVHTMNVAIANGASGLIITDRRCRSFSRVLHLLQELNSNNSFHSILWIDRTNPLSVKESSTLAIRIPNVSEASGINLAGLCARPHIPDNSPQGPLSICVDLEIPNFVSEELLESPDAWIGPLFSISAVLLTAKLNQENPDTPFGSANDIWSKKIIDLPGRIFIDADHPSLSALATIRNNEFAEPIATQLGVIRPDGSGSGDTCGDECPEECNGKCTDNGNKKCCSVDGMPLPFFSEVSN